MNIKKAKFKAQNVLYILATIVLLGWLVFFVFGYWGKNSSATKSTNSAVVTQINNGLQNLSKPNVITPSQTSGNANPLISNYLAAQKQITEQYLESANIFLHGGSTFKISSLNGQAYQQFNKSSNDLYEITNIITATQKFMEYNPQIDLVPLLAGDESGSNERLERTKNGINDVINSVKSSGYGKSKEIEAILAPLPNKVGAISKENASQWYKEVESAQKAILVIINDDFNTRISSSYSVLSEIAKSYLE